MTDQPFRIGDPVVDLAQGRPMIVLDAPDETVAEWSDREGYDLQSNYANSKLDPDADEAVVECVYVSDIRSEPSKTYTFPISRVALIDAHHADDGRRIRDRIVVEVVESLLKEASADTTRRTITGLASSAFGESVATEANELADVEQTIGVDDA